MFPGPEWALPRRSCRQQPGGRLADGPAGVRFTGAVLLAPLAEELFWRSFLIRVLEKRDFLSVPLGRAHWPSFAITAVLFALEHHLVAAGCMAGVLYTLTLYRTKSLAQRVLAHAATNACLGVWVLVTGAWRFW